MDADVRGWLYTKGADIPPKMGGTRLTEGILADNSLHKFPKDEIREEKGKNFYFLDGYVVNKEDLMRENKASTWEEAFIKAAGEKNFLENFRGGFCGIIKNEQGYLLFSDHVGNRAVYYYCGRGCLIVSNRFWYIIQVLKYNRKKLTYNQQAARYMLMQGFMLDNSTFANEIHRVLPGQKVLITPGGVSQERYYILDNEPIRQGISEEDAVELVDRFFRQAVRREFEKDIEYGYHHLVDLSGGLDSRMVTWVAHDMGYQEQTNLTYCRKDYRDFKIAQELALQLKHTFYFIPLDDFKWFCDMGEILRKNNGAAFYLGITGGNRSLKLLNGSGFGIEHTGMAGDVVLSAFYKNKEDTYAKPGGKDWAFPGRVKFDVPKEAFQEYKNKEIFMFEARSRLGAQSSYMIRQNYFETSSPFLDVDFLNAMFALPFELRRDYHIYLKWIEKKYPQAAEFGWEKWRGIQPFLKNTWKKKFLNYYDRVAGRLNRMFHKTGDNSMNPLDYWYEKNREEREWAERYFEDKIGLLSPFPELYSGARTMFLEGTVIEKSHALTVIGMAELIEEV